MNLDELTPLDLNPPRMIYLDVRDDSKCCEVDDCDYEWLQQWRWHWTCSRASSNIYATRVARVGKFGFVKIYMHKLILTERIQAIPPSPKHTVGDHEDRDTLNNTRRNLRWFTPSQNRLNQVR